jgi:phosphoribosylamine--glycine ligase
MNVLLLGSGGREHALAWKMAQSEKLESFFIAPGNAGTSDYGENVNLSPTDFAAV